MHGVAVYLKEGLPFAWDLSLENLANSYLCFPLALFLSVSYFFFLYQSPSLSLCMDSDSISSNVDKVLSINPSANVETSTSIIRTGSPILMELIYLVNYAMIFLFQMTLLRWLTFLLIFVTVTVTVLLFWIYLYLLMLVFVLQWFFLHWEIMIMLLSQFS